ncbi:MAG: hypothetical protein GXP62_12105, partial [Oligoflexia bacterium]|nr:hypothetical protein [Oligoflexia bacterium]
MAGGLAAPLGLVITVLCGCTSGAGPSDSGGDTGAAFYADPSQPGPWPVGTDVQTITGSSGVSLEIQAWFPRTDAQGSLHAYDDLLEGGALDQGSADCAQPHPVLVFSHGHGGMRWQSFFLTEHLASHGFIVVAP